MSLRQEREQTKNPEKERVGIGTLWQFGVCTTHAYTLFELPKNPGERYYCPHFEDAENLYQGLIVSKWQMGLKLSSPISHMDPPLYLCCYGEAGMGHPHWGGSHQQCHRPFRIKGSSSFLARICIQPLCDDLYDVNWGENKPLVTTI